MPADRAAVPIFKPAWGGDIGASIAASRMGDAREACESLESRGAVPIGWFTGGARRFAPVGSEVGDVMLSDTAESPSRMPGLSRENALLSAGVAGLFGAVLAVASSAASARAGGPSRRPLSRALVGAAAGVMSVIDGDASPIARAAGARGFARPALLPPHPWQAASIAALGAACFGRAEELALEAAARLGGPGARVVWRVLAGARGSSRWRQSGAWLGGEAWGAGRTAAEFARVAAFSASGADHVPAAVPIHEIWSMGLGFESARPTHGTVCIVCPRCPSFDRDTADGETGGGDV